MSRFVPLFLAILIVSIVSGCMSREGEEFIESADTQEQIKQLAIESFSKEYEADVFITEDGWYPKAGTKSERKDESKILVRYTTDHLPEYHGILTIDVDTEQKPRKLVRVSDYGLIIPQGLGQIDLYDELMHYIYPYAFESILTTALDQMGDFEYLTHEKSDASDHPLGLYINLHGLLDNSLLTEEQFEALLADYISGQFNQPSENGAQELLSRHLVFEENDSNNAKLPKININFSYDGVFSSEKMDLIIEKLLDVRDLPQAEFIITVDATDFIDGEDHFYAFNRDPYGEYGNIFKASVSISESYEDDVNIK